MSDIDVSVIIPVRDIEPHMNKIIKAIATDSCGIDIEVIVVDMASNDSTVTASLKALKANDVKGCVIQSGGDSVGSALNHGIYRSRGKYVTFMFPRKLYTGSICDYFSVAKNKDADFVFGTPPTIKSNSKIFIENPDSIGLLEGLIYDTLAIDSASVLISRQFIRENFLTFAENLRTGYTEKFIYDVLIRANNVVRSKTIMKRNHPAEAEKLPQENMGAECFDRVEAIISLCDTVPLSNPSRKYIVDILKGQKLPRTIFYCVDTLLRNGYGYKAVKNALKDKHYDEMLSANKYTDFNIKKKIFTWKMTPLLYKPN